MGKIYVGDIKTVLRTTITEDDDITPEDLSSLEEKEYYIQKPNRTSILIEGVTFETDGKDGVILYETVEGDHDQDGNHRIQLRALYPDGGLFRSESRSYEVYNWWN